MALQWKSSTGTKNQTQYVCTVIYGAETRKQQPLKNFLLTLQLK